MVLKKCECELLRAVVFMFEKLQLEINIYIYIYIYYILSKFLHISGINLFVALIKVSISSFCTA